VVEAGGEPAVEVEDVGEVGSWIGGLGDGGLALGARRGVVLLWEGLICFCWRVSWCRSW